MSDKRKIILKKLAALNTIWHPESTLVFKSQKDRLVIGRYVDDEVIPLDDEALTLCEEWKFVPDESLINAEQEAEEGGEEAEEEAEEQAEEPVPEAESIPEAEPVPEPEPKKIKKKVETTKVEATKVDRNVCKNLTLKFGAELDIIIADLYSHNDVLTKKLSDTISHAESERQALQAQYDALQIKYTTMENKFSAMKSLFT